MSLSMRRLRDDFSNHMEKLQTDFKAREDATLKEIDRIENKYFFPRDNTSKYAYIICFFIMYFFNLPGNSHHKGRK